MFQRNPSSYSDTFVEEGLPGQVLNTLRLDATETNPLASGKLAANWKITMINGELLFSMGY